MTTRLCFDDKQEALLREAFANNPEQALDMAIRGLRRLTLQQLELGGKLLQTPAPQLSNADILELRKKPLGIDVTKPWSDTLTFSRELLKAQEQLTQNHLTDFYRDYFNSAPE